MRAAKNPKRHAALAAGRHAALAEIACTQDRVPGGPGSGA